MTRRRHSVLIVLALGAVTFTVGACTSNPPVTAPTPPEPPPSAMPAPPPPAPPLPPAPPPDAGVMSDSDLFTLVTQTQPFAAYTRFPSLPTDPDGILTASSAHQPLIRVSVNATAAGALQNGKLPSGAKFPDGSIIFKEVLTSGRLPSVSALMYKDGNNTQAGNGWLWAEYRPDGGVVFSIMNKGDACTGCHALAQGRQNDSVRIFERQR